MTTEISKELFLAILSMDSYNRGYGEGVSGLGGVGSLLPRWMPRSAMSRKGACHKDTHLTKGRRGQNDYATIGEVGQRFRLPSLTAKL
jgi:hypothetical protein